MSARAIADAVARCNRDFNYEHGRQQRAVMERLEQGRLLAMTIGVADSGKSALLAPLADAWRQTDDLASAGIGATARSVA